MAKAWSGISQLLAQLMLDQAKFAFVTWKLIIVAYLADQHLLTDRFIVEFPFTWNNVLARTGLVNIVYVPKRSLLLLGLFVQLCPDLLVPLVAGLLLSQPLENLLLFRLLQSLLLLAVDDF
jgi:hypothetical protein